MPKVKRGNGSIDIPFNPDLIAGLIYNGFEVFPDQGGNLEIEKSLIDQSLRKLWGNQALRTVPGRLDNPGKNFTWDTFETGETFKTFQDKLHDYRKVLPDPNFNFEIPEYENKPAIELEAKEGILSNIFKKYFS